MSIAVENVPICPLCGSDEAEWIADSRDRQHRLPGEFAFVRCNSCTLVRLSPRPTPEELGTFYPSDQYYSYRPDQSIRSVPHGRPLDGLRNVIRTLVLDARGYHAAPLRWWQRAMQPLAVRLFSWGALYAMPDRFPRFVENGFALDVGSGAGSYLSFLKHHGWRVQGVDISREAARVAHEMFGIDVFEGSVEDAPFADESFDFIHLSHIIEHVPDPVSTLSRVARLLKRSGTLYIATPNVESYGRRRCGDYWLGWQTPRHLFMFTPDTLRRTAERAGVRITKLWTQPHPGIYAWEETYRREELIGAAIDPRPVTSLRARLRSRTMDFVGALHNRFYPLDGESISCYAERA